jgi:hypothetical protein
MQTQIALPTEKIAEFCQRHPIHRLALFGSALRGDLRPDSDIDLLVEFRDDSEIGLFAMGTMQVELSELLGRDVDLKTADFLSPRFRQRVIEQAVTIYEEG